MSRGVVSITTTTEDDDWIELHAYGLAIGGEDGVVHVLRSLLAEADLIMAVDGYPTLKDLTPEVLRRVT